MAIQSDWGDTHQSYVVTSFRHEWTWAELHDHEKNDAIRLLERAPRPNALIMDLRNSVWVKPDNLVDEISRSAALHQHFQTEVVIFVLADIAIGTLLTQLYSRHGWSGCQYVHMTSMDQAHEHIRSRFAYHS